MPTASPPLPRPSRIRAAAAALCAVLLALAGGLVSAPAHAATVDTGAWYVLVNRHSGKALDVYNLATGNGAAIVQWSRNDGAWQQWRFVDSGGGYYRLQSRHSGKVLDIYEWSTAGGAQVVQWDDHNGANQQFRLADSDGGHVRLINRHSGKALEVWEWSTSDGARVSQWDDHNGANQQWRLVKVGDSGGGNNGGGGNTTGLVGWATQGGGTTGGGNAAVTTVTSASALTGAASGTGAAVIRVSGTITCSGMLRVGSNKTIIGNPGATISGCGLNVRQATNVIIRNLTFRNWDDDAINVEESTRVWIDHNTLSNGYDGAIDVKRGSDYVTVSWNRIFGHDKAMLLGHSDGNGSQDRGKLRVTYHHNWFDGTNQRHPRVRFGNPVHVYNNYYGGVTGYGVASTVEAGVLVEGNYFENTRDPFHRGEGSSAPGSLVARNNHFVNSGSGDQGGSVAGIPYAYTLDAASSVKSIVTNGAGAGKINI